MNGLSKVIILLAVSCTIIGCAPPVGGISGDGSSSFSGNELIASPKRYAYDIPVGRFERENDLNVFLSDRDGFMRTIPLTKVNISIVENPISAPDVITPISTDYIFITKGRKKVLVEYNKLVAEYYVEVADPHNMGGDGDGDGDSHGIEVIWLY